MWIFLAWVALIGIADSIPQKHSNPCIEVPEKSWNRTIWNKEIGIHRAVPFPLRIGKEKQKFKAGYIDRCTGEIYNGYWWYKEAK